MRVAFRLALSLFSASSLLATQTQRTHAQLQTVRASDAKPDQPVLRSPPAPVFKDSTVFFGLKIPTTAMSDAVSEVTDIYRELGMVEACPASLCNYSYDVKFTRDGPPEIKADQQALKVTVFIAASGEVSVRPTGLLEFTNQFIDGEKLHSRFSGRLEVTLTAKPTIEPDWCIDPRATLTTKWTEPPKIKSGILNLDLGHVSLVEKRIEERIDQNLRPLLANDTIASAKGTLCDLLRDRLARIWRTHAIPIALKERSVFLTIQPNYVRYAGPRITSAGMELGIGMGARTYISTVEKYDPPRELPKLQQTNAIKSEVYIEVPAVITLRDIKTAAEELVAAETFDLSLPLTGLRVRPRNIEPTLARERVEFAVDYALSAWWLPIELTGKATISGEPRVDPIQNLIVLDRVEANVSLNNGWLGGLFSVATRRASVELQDRVRRVAKHNAGPYLDFSRNEIEKQINQLDAVSGVRFHLSGLKPTLDRIAVGDGGVNVFANASGVLDAELHGLPPALRSWLKRLGDSPFKKDYKIVYAKGVAVKLRKQPDDDSAQVGIIPHNATSLKVHDCQLGQRNKKYKWCNVTYGPKQGWVHQFNLAPM